MNRNFGTATSLAFETHPNPHVNSPPFLIQVYQSVSGHDNRNILASRQSSRVCSPADGWRHGMLFPTTIFAIFFATLFYLHWALVERPRLWKPLLLAASYLFYGFWNWKFIFLIAIFTVLNHWAACAMDRYPPAQSSARKRILVAILLFDLGILAFFKYAGFLTLTAIQALAVLGLPPDDTTLRLLEAVGRIVLPVGISFFTFQGMSYVIDVYRGDFRPGRSLLDFANYLAFFPQLVAGPIVRARDLLPQMEHPPRRDRPLDTSRASFLILAGLFKKTVIANFLAERLADPVFAHPASFSGPDALLGVWGYALQIYCDFSAYSDIAIGLALLLGFHFPINFNAPYFALSIRDFWHRWHISLSTWLRDYLYIPLGGSRGGERQTYRNQFLTFLLGGLWHGAGWTFLIWGAFHGLSLVLERFLARLFGTRESDPPPTRFWPVVLRRLGVFHWVCLSWIFFRCVSLTDALAYFRSLTDWSRPATLWSPTVGLALAAGWCLQYLDGTRAERLWVSLACYPKPLQYAGALLQGAASAAILTVILAMGPRGVAPFIYFQF